ncbi:MAG: hypothetical protein RLW61_13250 [Gammaproteobacteria bacterium]
MRVPPAGILLLAILAPAAGCAMPPVSELLYGLGDQYACSARNDNRRAERALDAACADPGSSGRTRYADYQRARAGE